MEPLEAMRELRFTLVEAGHTLPQVAPVMDGLRRELNMVGKPHVERGGWASSLGVKNLVREKAEFVFHAGCRYSFDGDLAGVARTSVRLLQKAGVDFGIMGEAETCCGGRAHGMGFRSDFQTRCNSNLTAWQRAGVKTVITPCSDCYHTFKRLYPPESGSTIQVVHMVEFLDRLIREDQMNFTRPVPLTVTYHDPCHLGRQGEQYVAWNGKEKKIFGQAVCYDPPRPRYNGAFGIYDPPRNILKAIPELRLVEMERSREASWCCGAGGGAREAFPDFSRWTANERIEEAVSTGAEALVTACPWCERNFLDATAGSRKLAVFDVMQLVERAL
jgi:Fe-S oxidoreductase